LAVQTWHRTLFGVLLVGAVAVGGIALNFTLLRLTQDAHDPVGKLSPRAVFAGTAPTPGTSDTNPGPARTTPAKNGHPDHDHDSDD